MASGRLPDEKSPTVALLAHDTKKQDLVRVVRDHADTLALCRVVATRATGQAIVEALTLPVELVEGGPLGGDLQLAGMVVDGRIDAVVFLRDPLTADPFEPDPQALLKVCDVHDVPIATNAASAHALLGLVGSSKRYPLGAR